MDEQQQIPPAPVPTATRSWDIPRQPGRRAGVVLGRALRRRCPYCGGSGIFAGWWTLRQRCPSCQVQFNREDGYFLGAYALNLVFAEILGLGLALYLLFGTDLRDLPLGWQMVIAGGLAVAFPILLFPYSRTIWIALDLMLNPPGDDPERYLRGHDMQRPSSGGR
jgi:uncharacterized protein (DUF983 family)